MIDSKNRAKEPVKYSEWQNCLPEADKVEPKRYATEYLVALDGSQNFSRSSFRLQNREDARTNAIKHSRIYIIRCNSCKSHAAVHPFELDTHRV